MRRHASGTAFQGRKGLWERRTELTPRTGYAWATPGDVNEFSSLRDYNIANMILLAGLLVGTFGFPAYFVLSRMVPGTAVGGLVGDLIYTYMAFSLARRSGDPIATEKKTTNFTLTGVHQTSVEGVDGCGSAPPQPRNGTCRTG